jgi:hypothetical protein
MIAENAPYATFINAPQCKRQHCDEIVPLNVETINRAGAGSPGFISASTHETTDGNRVVDDLLSVAPSASFPCSPWRER